MRLADDFGLGKCEREGGMVDRARHFSEFINPGALSHGAQGRLIKKNAASPGIEWVQPD